MKSPKILLFFLCISILFNAYFLIKLGIHKYQLYTYKDPKIQIAANLVDSNSVIYSMNRNLYYDTLNLESNSNIFIGDSHFQNYPTQLLFKSPHNINRGINGDVSLGLLHRLDKILTSKPARIFIEIGINDLMNGLPTSQLMINYQKIIEKISKKSPKTQIYVLSIFPTSWYISNTQTPLHQSVLIVNEELSKLKNVRFINLYDKLADDLGALNIKYDSGDRLHLNYEGYKIVSETINKVLN